MKKQNGNSFTPSISQAIKGKDMEYLKVPVSLNAIFSHRNLTFIGPPDTGKTHPAQAFDYAYCQRGLMTYFIKASEL